MQTLKLIKISFLQSNIIFYSDRKPSYKRPLPHRTATYRQEDISLI